MHEKQTECYITEQWFLWDAGKFYEAGNFMSNWQLQRSISVNCVYSLICKPYIWAYKRL